MTLEGRDLVLGYGEGSPVLASVTLALEAGDLVGLIGPNGSGKSTLLRTLLGLHMPRSGSVTLDGEPVSTLARADVARRVAYVPQRLSGAPPFTLHELVLQGRHAHRTSWLDSERDREAAAEAMRRTEIWELRHRRFDEVSGGEAQRALIASALCQEPDYLILDEPNSALDVHFAAQLFDLLTSLSRDGDVAVCVATHDLNLASVYCDRLVLLSDGGVAARGTPGEVLTEEQLIAVYGPELCVVEHPNRGVPIVLPRGSAP